MNINSAEQSLAKYRLLHFVIGAIVGAVVLAVPKLATAVLIVVAMAFLVPAATLPIDFHRSKWFDRGALLAGAIVAAVVLHLLGRL